MNIQTGITGMASVGLLAALMLGIHAASAGENPAGAEPVGAVAEVATPDVSVRIAPLKGTGGAIGKGPDGAAIEQRFTTALQKLLAESAKGKFSTNGTTKDSDFVVEGELSALQTPKNAAGGYLCTVRLFQTAKAGRRLVGQWSGTAKTVRDLTGNLTKDTRVSSLGLAGELAKRIGAVVTASAGDAPKPVAAEMTPAVYNALIKKATADRRLMVDVVPVGAANPKPRNTLLPGEKYNLKVSAQDAGTVYVLQLIADKENDGKPKSPYAQNEAPSALPGRPVLLPPNSPFTAPASGSADWVVFVRRETEGKAGMAAPSASVIVPRSMGSRSGFVVLPGAPSDDPYGVADVPPDYGVPDVSEDKAVTVIGGALVATPIAATPAVAATKSELDDETERILKMMQTDPAGTWVALEIKLPVVPAGKMEKKSGAAAPAGVAPREVTIPGVALPKP